MIKKKISYVCMYVQSILKTREMNWINFTKKKFCNFTTYVHTVTKIHSIHENPTSYLSLLFCIYVDKIIIVEHKIIALLASIIQDNKYIHFSCWQRRRTISTISSWRETLETDHKHLICSLIKMVFDIGMPNIAVNPLDGALFEIVKHKTDKTRSIFRDLKGSLLTQQTRLQVK